MARPNPHHIDLLKNQAVNITGPGFKLKAGTNAVLLAGVFDGATVTLQVQPAGSARWYDRPAGTFTVVGLVDTQFWINSALPEGKARGILADATANTLIEEFILRPVIEYEYEV